jgi:hypothetical protein
MDREIRRDCKAPTVPTGFMYCDRDAVIIGFPLGWAAGDKSSVEELVLDKLFVVVTIQKFVLVVKVCVPPTPELPSRLQPCAKRSKKLH